MIATVKYLITAFAIMGAFTFASFAQEYFADWPDDGDMDDGADG